MGYAQYKASDAYKKRHSGAGLVGYLVDVVSGKEFRVGHSGSNFNSNIEQIPTRQAGSKKPDEIVTGASEPTFSMDGLWTADANDNEIPNEGNFIDKEYFYIEKIAPGRPSAGTVVNAVIGFKPASVNISHGNGGVVPFSMSGPCIERLSGQQYADEFGAN